MIASVLLSVIVVVITILLLYIKWSLNYWKKNNVYTPPVTFPFGNAKGIIVGRDNLWNIALDVYKNVKKRKERYGGFYLVSEPVFLPVDINLLRDVLITDFQHFTDHALFFNEDNDPLSAHLFNLTGAKWKALRTKLTTLFTSGKLKMMFQTITDCTKNFPAVLDQAIERGEPIDIKETFARYTTDIIGSVAFGVDCNCMVYPDTEFRKYGKRIFEIGPIDSIKSIINRVYPQLMKYFRMKVMKNDVENFFIHLVKETIEYRQKNNVHRNDFIQLLMSLMNQELKVDVRDNKNNANTDATYYQNGLTIEDVAAQAFVFFVAGFETSSTTLTFLMFEIVQNDGVQEKLRDEIQRVLEKYDGNITYEGIKEMTYLDKCVYEALRKFPSVPAIPRVCTKDYKVPESDLIIKKGTCTIIPVFAVHRDEEYYPEPEKFDPERFSEENKSKRPPVSFLSLGEGPRTCIGLRMGILQVKVGVIAMLKDYKFSLNSKTKVPLEFNGRFFLLTSKGGIWLNVSKI